MNTTHNATLLIWNALEGLIKPCLTIPNALRITTIGNGDLPVFEILVAQADMGRMVGKQGTNVMALKFLLKAMATAQEQPCGLVLSDPIDIRQVAGKDRTPPWSAKECEEAISRFLDTAKRNRAVSVVPGRPGQHTVILAESLPEQIEQPLSRWLNVMGVEGQTRLVLEDIPE